MLQGALAGLAIGGVYALTAVSLTLMARLVRVINFAQVAVAMFGVFTAVRIVDLGIPQPVAMVLGVLAGGGISALLGLVLATWLPDASISVRSAATVGALLVLIAASFLLFGTKPQVFGTVLAGAAFSVAGVSVSQVTVAMVLLAVLVAGTAYLVLRLTRAGTVLRAIADRPVTAELVGIPVRRVAVTVWAVVGVVMTIAVTVIAPTQTSDALTLSMLVVPAMAAALLGAFSSLALSAVGGIVLGLLQGAIAQFGDLVLIRSWVPLVLIVAFLLYNQRREVWDAAR